MCTCYCLVSLFFFFNDAATTEIYTLSLHDALPICRPTRKSSTRSGRPSRAVIFCTASPIRPTSSRRRSPARSEEHTSELQSREKLVCRLLLEKKKNTSIMTTNNSTASHTH